MISRCIAMKRAYKLQEFVAHTSNVNCLKIGRKSSGVLVTGGEDKKVNMWAIGKPTAILVRPARQWFNVYGFSAHASRQRSSCMLKACT